MKMATKNLQGFPTLITVCTDPQTEYNNQNFTRVSPNGFFLIYLVKMVSVAITEGENNIFTIGYPTDIFFWFI